MYKTQDNNFNLIRFALATLVIYSHSTPLIHGNNDLEYLKSTFGSFTFGTLAVNLFFAISGYMILKSWMSKPDLKRFCRARILRIYPGFFFVTMFSVFFLNSVGSTFSSNFERIDKLVLLKCLVLLRDFPASADFMPNFPVPALNGSLWTIIYEFKFYMLIALAGSLDVAKRLKFWMAIFLGSILIYSFELFTFLDESRLFLFVIGSSKDTSRLLITTVRLIPEQCPLVIALALGNLYNILSKHCIYRGFLENHNVKNLEDFVKTTAKLKLLAHNGYKDIH